MPVSPVSPEEISNSASAVNPLPTNRSLVGVVSNLASQVNPDLFFALGARTHTLSQLVAPIEQLRQARRVEDLPTVENLGNVLPSDETQGDLTLPVESVSLTLLMGLVDRFRGHSSGDVRLTSVCASLIKSTDNLNQSTAYQLIHVHEVLSCGPNPRPAIVESAALKLKQAYLSKIKMSPMTFAWAPLEWRQDFHVALSAAKQSGNLLRHMPFELQDNEVIVTEAVRNAPEAVQYASPRLRDHENIGIMAVSRFGPTLFYLSERLKNTPTVVRLAVRENGLALQHASERLRQDPPTIGLAIRQNPRAVRYVM